MRSIVLWFLVSQHLSTITADDWRRVQIFEDRPDQSPGALEICEFVAARKNEDAATFPGWYVCQPPDWTPPTGNHFK